MTTHYQTLGIQRDADDKAIKKAWRQQSSAHHSDKHGGDDTAMKGVNEAYECLSDPVKRAAYDADDASATEAQLQADTMDALEHSIANAIDLGMMGNVVSYLRNEYADNAVTLQAARGRAHQRLRFAARWRRRLIYKGAGKNLVAAVLDAACHSARREINEQTRALEIIGRLHIELANYEDFGPQVGGDDIDTLQPGTPRLITGSAT